MAELAWLRLGLEALRAYQRSNQGAKVEDEADPAGGHLYPEHWPASIQQLLNLVIIIAEKKMEQNLGSVYIWVAFWSLLKQKEINTNEFLQVLEVYISFKHAKKSSLAPTVRLLGTNEYKYNI